MENLHGDAAVLSAFLCLDVLSLVFLLCIGAGMALPEGWRRRTWALVTSCWSLTKLRNNGEVC